MSIRAVAAFAACVFLSWGVHCAEANFAEAPTYIPRAFLERDGIAALEALVARYKDRDPGSLKPNAKKGDADGSCKLGPDRELVLGPTGTQQAGYGVEDIVWPSRTYVGEAQPKTCLPDGHGRIDMANGVWIGAVTWMRHSRGLNGGLFGKQYVSLRYPFPNGLGVFIAADGTNFILDWRYLVPRPASREAVDTDGMGITYLARYIGAFTADGTAVVYETSEFFPGYDFEPSQLARMPLVGTLHRADGTRYRGRLKGTAMEEGGTYWRTDLALGLQVMAQFHKAGTMMDAERQRVALTKPLRGLAPGYYWNLNGTKWHRVAPGDLDAWMPSLVPTTAQKFEDAVRGIETDYLVRSAWTNEAEEHAARQREIGRMVAERNREMREEIAASQQAWNAALGGMQQAFDQGAAEMRRTQEEIARQQASYDATAKAIQAQQAEQDRLNREEAERQARDRAAGERAYAEAQASAAQNKAQAEAAYQQQRQIDQARAQAAANDAARRAAGAYGAAPSAPSSGSSSGYAGSSAAASGGGALPKPDTAKIDRCAKLSRDIMSAGSDFHCNMNGKGFPTISAQRDAESKCYAEVAAKVAPLKAQYQDECSSSPTDGGVTRY